MFKILKTSLSIAFMLVLLCSCWDRRETEELLLTDALAIDIPINDSDKYEIFFIATKQSSGGEQTQDGEEGGSQMEAQPWVARSQGKSLEEAINKFTVRVPRFIFLDDNKIIILGEKLAQRGVGETLDYLLRKRDLRLRNYIVISNGRVSNSLAASPEFEDGVADEIVAILEKGSQEGDRFHHKDIKKFAEDVVTEGQDAWAPIIEIITPTEVVKYNVDKAVIINKTALFHKDKMVGILDREDTKGFKILKGLANRDTFATEINNENITYAYNQVKVNRSLTTNSDRVGIKYDVKLKGNIAESHLYTDFCDKALKDLEEKFSKVAEEEIKSSVSLMQKLGSDALGIGRFIHAKEPDIWKNYRDNWDMIYQDIDIVVKVDAKIIGTDFISKPIIRKSIK
ncbi:Ger(x)C family spore germination protein [Alkaliphilus pronyensis]|uniref:Ger(X)C family spore germination protein n=1 Tax=Alkaliphilus pronyensis TaxID=1482732 RepID=A0A6I0F8L6_9FIRM|nr:Ger(x)C family spore germination protein [Alkaliphilus pronyensis]KAB3534854.1 Ger(x)C family spore germination protein [Alkaliphilus pronyensis]